MICVLVCAIAYSKLMQSVRDACIVSAQCVRLVAMGRWPQGSQELVQFAFQGALS